MNVREIKINSDLQMKKRAEAKKRFKKRLFWLKFILIFILSCTTIVLIALTPMFNIEAIEVKGISHCTRESVLDATDLAIGRNGFKTIGSSVLNILTLRYGKAEENILKSDPYIKQAVVRYSIPSKVVIEITERIPEFMVPYLGTNLLMDKEGYIIDTLKSTGDSAFPVLKGLEFEDFALGRQLKLDKPEKLESAVSIMEALEDSDKIDAFKICKLISTIDVSDPENVRMLVDSRITVNMGDLQDIKYRISFLKQIYQGNIKKEDKGYLDFSSGDNPSFIPQSQ